VSDYPAAIWYPAHLTNVLGPPNNNPKGWVLHTPEEPADDYPGTPYWFAREHPAQAGSTHYFDSYLGFVYQCVAEPVGAIANGVLGKLYPAWADTGVSLNRQTLSVEIEGYAASIAQTISPAQEKALVDLLAYGCLKYRIPADRAHIIGHYEVASNRSDPGTLDIDRIVTKVQAALQEDDMDEATLRRIVKEEVYLALSGGSHYLPDKSFCDWVNLVAADETNPATARLVAIQKAIKELKAGTIAGKWEITPVA